MLQTTRRNSCPLADSLHDWSLRRKMLFFMAVAVIGAVLSEAGDYTVKELLSVPYGLVSALVAGVCYGLTVLVAGATAGLWRSQSKADGRGMVRSLAGRHERPRRTGLAELIGALGGAAAAAAWALMTVAMPDLASGRRTVSSAIAVTVLMCSLGIFYGSALAALVAHLVNACRHRHMRT